MADFDLDIQDLVDEFQEQYKNDGQTAKDIKVQLFEQNDFAELFNSYPESNTVYESVYSTVGEVLQAYSEAFTPKGNSKYTPYKQSLGHAKIDLQLGPDKMLKSWLGFWTDLDNDVDRAKWPFIKWWLTNHIIPQAKEDKFLKVDYWGWEYTGVAGSQALSGSAFTRVVTSAMVAAGLPADASTDGIHTIIAKLYAADRLGAVVTTGTLETDPEDFCTQIEQMFLSDDIGEALRAKLDFANMSLLLKRRYREGRRRKYNMQYAQVGDLDIIEGTEMKVRGSLAQTGSNQIWASPASNRQNPIKAKNMGKFDVQKVDRKVKFLSDWMEVNVFEVPELVVVNDQDLTISNTMITDRYTIS